MDDETFLCPECGTEIPRRTLHGNWTCLQAVKAERDHFRHALAEISKPYYLNRPPNDDWLSRTLQLIGMARKALENRPTLPPESDGGETADKKDG